MMLTGRCHCGNLELALEWGGDPQAIPARACSCTFCTKHGAVWTSSRDASVELRVRDPRLESRYVFGTETARFHLCQRCGVVALASCELDGQLYAVVNIHTFEAGQGLGFDHGSADFDGEAVEDRLDRRRQHWIPQVRLLEERRGA